MALARAMTWMCRVLGSVALQSLEVRCAVMEQVRELERFLRKVGSDAQRCC